MPSERDTSTRSWADCAMLPEAFTLDADEVLDARAVVGWRDSGVRDAGMILRLLARKLWRLDHCGEVVTLTRPQYQVYRAVVMRYRRIDEVGDTTWTTRDRLKK